jgi:hypothetical protein
MSSAKETENLLDPLTERINPNGWRVISNPVRQPTPEAHKLKTLMQTVQKQQRVPLRRRLEETDPPEAA